MPRTCTRDADFLFCRFRRESELNHGNLVIIIYDRHDSSRCLDVQTTKFQITSGVHEGLSGPRFNADGIPTVFSNVLINACTLRKRLKDRPERVS